MRACGHTAPLGVFNVFRHPVGMDSFGKVARETLSIQSKRYGGTAECRFIQLMLLHIEIIMHLLISTLASCGFSRHLGNGMDAPDRKVAKDDPQPVAQTCLQILDDRAKLVAVRALIVGIG